MLSFFLVLPKCIKGVLLNQDNIIYLPKNYDNSSLLLNLRDFDEHVSSYFELNISTSLWKEAVLKDSKKKVMYIKSSGETIIHCK